MTTALRLALVIVAALGAMHRTAHADVARYAIVVGNNTGDRGDVQLRYAERDAERVAGALIDLGGFPAANVVMLPGNDADTMRASVIAINDRIRSEHHAETMLVVYYSGHADATDLHLGRSTMPIAQLEQLVRGSAASVRLLALDSCRSGVLTRVKGGHVAPPIAITVGDTLDADGVVFWAASAASEDAQESDDIQGSFFTHFLVSGLAGPADVSGDGKVTIGEAFEYARLATLRASSRTLAGPQHPTFRDEVRGRQDIVLTNPGAADRMASIELPADRDVLVMADSEAGRVIGEVGAHDSSRRLAFRPGRYFVRERADGYLLEGTIAVAAGPPHVVVDGELHRLAYAALVRKGGHGHQDAITFGLASRSSVTSGGGLCTGAEVGYQIALPWITATPELAICREHTANEFVGAALTEVASALAVSHVWDLGRVGVMVGGRAGASLFHESFTTSGTAPPRTSPALTFGLSSGIEVHLAPRVAVSAELGVVSYVFREIGIANTVSWVTPLAARGVIGVNVAW